MPLRSSSPTDIVFDSDDEDDEDDDEEDLDPYTQVADSEFSDPTSGLDWGGELGRLRQRMGDVDSGKSQDPSNALFRLLSAQTPNESIGKFVSSADPKIVTAMRDAVGSLLGGLSSTGVETIVKTNGEKIGSLCFQLQMTGYLFRNAEYIMALRELMDLRGKATLRDYQKAFERLDVDGSGYIETTEVKKLLDSVYDGQAPKFEVDAFMQFFDTDNDGRISWEEFERGLGSAIAQSNTNRPRLGSADDDDDEDEEDDEDDDSVGLGEPEVSGEIEVELESGKMVKIEARDYIQKLKAEAEALRQAIAQAQGGTRGNNNNLLGAPRADDFGGIAQYIASRQGDVKALTEGIQPEVVETMKMLVDFVLEGGGAASRKNVPKEEMEMEIPGSALQQLALWQLVLGYKLRELEATGEYLKLLE